MLDREVDGPVWVVLGRSWGLCMRAWAALGAFVGGLAALVASVGDLGPLLGPCGRSWATLAAYVGGLGLSSRLCWRSWAALVASVGHVGPLLGLCGRSWAALTAYVAT